jgi:putative peptidoglycan lipid II flippase
VRGRLADLARRYLPSGAVIVSALYLGSYVVGLLRERVLAGTFGAGAELDAYNAAFQLPELLFDVLVEAGLAAAFIPVFARLRSTEAGVADADRFARTVLTLSIAAMGAGSVLLFWFAVAPILYSTGIIVGTLAFSDAIGIYAAAVGAVLGAILHLGSRLVGLRGTAFRVGFDWELRTAQMGEFVRLTIPRLISQPIEPITFAFFTNLASRMAAGSLTVFNMARNFQGAPVTFVGASFAVAAFPALSTAYADGDRPTFVRLVGRNLVSIVVLTVLASIAMVVLGEIAIGILLGGGAFGPDDVSRTAAVLSAFALSVPFESTSQLLSRAIFATRHTLFQALASIAGLLFAMAATLLLLDGLELLALPIGFAIGQATKAGLLAVVLGWRLRAWTATSPLAASSG